MKTSFAILSSCVLLSLQHPSPAAAQAETPEFRKCMDAVDLGAFKNTQWAACYEAELKRQDRALNTAYQQIQKQAAPDLKQALTKGQRAWLAYRDAWCAYEEQTPVAPGGMVNKMACLVDLTIAQIKRLKESSAD